MKRILVVDNDESTVDAIADLLRDTDYDALTATTGEQALTMLFRLRPDLLILDMFMPGLNGWQVLDAIAGDSVLARMPKVAMTAWPFPIDLPPGVALLHKPFEWESARAPRPHRAPPPTTATPRDLESSRAVLLPAHARDDRAARRQAVSRVAAEPPDVSVSEPNPWRLLAPAFRASNA